MKRVDLTVSRRIAGPPDEVFDQWFDPSRPGGPWHGAKKTLMNFAVDGFFYFGIERETWERHTGGVLDVEDGLLGHFGRFVAIDRARSVIHTWMSELTHGIETTVLVTFEPREGGTQMTIVHRGVPDDDKGRMHEGGWTNLLSRLDHELRSNHKRV